MARTDGDTSTSSELMLLYAVRALVARCCGLIPEAERLILHYANKGHFKHFGGSGQVIDPRHWGACDEELGFYIPVDFERSTVKYVRLPAAQATSYTTRLRLDDHLEPFYGAAYAEMREASLARDQVFSMLRELELLPALASEQAATGSPVSEMSSLEPLSSPTREEPQGWQAKRAVRFLRKRYPPEGKTSRKKTHKVLQAEFAVDPDVVAENRRHIRRDPSEEVMSMCRNYLGYID